MACKHYKILLLQVFFAIGFLAHGETIIVLEAENGVLTLPSKVKSVSGYSGGKYVGDNDPGSSIVFRNVEVPEEGTYEFRTYYTSMHIRSIAIKSGFNPQIICTTPETTPDWNTPPVSKMITYIYLNKGINTIKITPYGGGGPNIDKFEIASTSISMPRPKLSNFSYEYDLSDDAIVTSSGTQENLSNISDNNDSTVYTYTSSSVQIKMECDLPYLLTGYYFTSGIDNSLNVKNWKLEYSTDAITYFPISPTQANDVENGVFFGINRNPHSDSAKSAKYYRITAYGGKIGEIQLFGIPYLPNSDKKNFPIDITENVVIRDKTLGEPLGVYQYNTFDERYFNLFDRDMSKKYYWHSSTSFWVEVELEKETLLNYYTLTSCQDYPERDPKTWVVEGFDTSWEIISEVTDFKFPSRYASMKFFTEKKKAYKGFRLRVIENNGADSFQLLKWQLFEDKQTGLSPKSFSASPIMITTPPKQIVVLSEYVGKCSIFNLSGHMVALSNTNSHEHRFQMDRGIYVVKFMNADRNFVQKVIVR